MLFFKFFKIEDELNIVILQFGVSETVYNRRSLQASHH
jgi:hypothetical protein